MDNEQLKKRIADDGEKAVEAQIVKHRGRKPRRQPEQTLTTGTRTKADGMSEEEIVKVIEDEFGKRNLLRLAVRYIFAKIGG